MTHKISIALCSFNGEEFLSEQLESYLQQSRLPDELVVCDDGSTDATINLLEQFARNSPFPVHIYKNETNLGFAKNFEKAISFCCEDIVFLSDQDDVWMPDKLEIVGNKFLGDPDLLMVFTDAELVDENLKFLGVNLLDVAYNSMVKQAIGSKRFLHELLFQNHVSGATTAFRRGLVDYLNPFPDDIPHMNHDGWVGLLGVVIGKFEFVDLPLNKYRQHASQQIGIYEVKPQIQSKNPDQPLSYFEEASKAAISASHRIGTILENFRRKENLSPYVPAIESVALPILRELRRKIGHYEGRSNLPRSPIARARFVLNEMLNGNYSRFSRGLKSVSKDMFYL
ncbi:MAG: glycosyltransferase family 2 protein [Acidobacteriota bacterium]